MSSISDRVLRLREENNFSRKKLAELAGVSQPTIYNIENGKTDNITLSVGKGIAKALGISFGELFEIEGPLAAGSEDENLLNEKEAKIADLKKQIEQKDKLIDFLQEENEDLKYSVAFFKISNHFEGIIGDEKFVRSINEPERIPHIEVRMNHIKEHLEEYIKSGTLSEKSILSILFNNHDFIDLMENESETKEEFVKKTAAYFNRFFSIAEKEVEKYIEINLNLKWDSKKWLSGKAWKNKPNDFKDYWKITD